MDIDNDLNVRRRSPGWLRAFEDRPLHGLALRLRAKFWQGTSTSKEDWLLDMAISELEYRHRKAIRTPGERACCCELCLGPFPLESYLEVADEDRRYEEPF